MSEGNYAAGNTVGTFRESLTGPAADDPRNQLVSGPYIPLHLKLKEQHRERDQRSPLEE